MYLEHFGLAVNPFGLSPKLDFLYKSETFEESMAHLVYGLDHQEAIVLITGAIGTGKTMALQSFLVNLGPRFEFALITNTRLTAVELLKLTLEDLGVEFPVGCDKSDLLILFKDFLLEASRTGKRVLIVVDEAQNLSSEVLEEIRLLTNLGQGESQPVQIILVGQPELEATVNHPDLAQLRQRIRVHYSLDPLSRKEIEEYIHHRMAVAGCTRKVFTPDAIDSIFQESRGIPRLVNTLAGEALLSAFVAGNDKVRSNDVEEDKDLSQEPGQESGPPVPKLRPETVEPLPVEPPRVVPEYKEPSPPQMVDRETARPRPVDIPARKPRPSMWKVMRVWVAAALLVIVLGALNFFGVFEGVIAAINPQGSSETQKAVQVPIAQGGQQDPRVKTKSDPGLVEDPSGGIEVTKKVEQAAQAEQPEVQKEDSADGSGVGNAYIHVSSFRTPERAESLKRRLESAGPGSVVLNMDVRKETWYRVYLGPYASREEAYLDAIRLKEEGKIPYYRLTTIEPDQLD